MSNLGSTMDERTARVRDHIAALRAEAAAERLASAARAEQGRSPGVAGLRRRAGRALVAIGQLLHGPAECDACPDGVAAASGA